MRRRGKAITLTTVALGLAVLVGAGFPAKDRIVEEWWIHKLKTGDEVEKRAAAERLGDIGAERAKAEILRFYLLKIVESWVQTIKALQPPLRMRPVCQGSAVRRRL